MIKILVHIQAVYPVRSAYLYWDIYLRWFISNRARLRLIPILTRANLHLFQWASNPNQIIKTNCTREGYIVLKWLMSHLSWVIIIRVYSQYLDHYQSCFYQFHIADLQAQLISGKHVRCFIDQDLDDLSRTKSRSYDKNHRKKWCHMSFQRIKIIKSKVDKNFSISHAQWILNFWIQTVDLYLRYSRIRIYHPPKWDQGTTTALKLVF